MISIKIIALGKLKETYWKEAESEYIKRLSPYSKLSIIELPEEPFREGSDRENIKEKEAKKVLDFLGKNESHISRTIFVLDEHAKQYTSHEFASLLEKNSTRGEEIFFIIGGPLGLHSSLLQKADKTLSLSLLTFPHQMVRTILLEQIYRAMTLLQNKTYHY